MINFVVNVTQNIISSNNIIDNYGGDDDDKNVKNQNIPALRKFIIDLVNQSNVQTPTLLCTVVYLLRLKKLLFANIDDATNGTRVTGISTTRHRIFIGCLIISGKNLNDSSPLNKHWANYTKGLLTLTEINKIEIEILNLLDWKLNFSNLELIDVLKPLLLVYNEKFYLNWQRKNLLCLNSDIDVDSNYNKKTNTNKTINNNHNSFLALPAKLHIRSDSNMSIPSLISSNTVSTIDDSPLKNSIISNSSPLINNNLSIITMNNPYNMPLTKQSSNNLQKIVSNQNQLHQTNKTNNHDIKYPANKTKYSQAQKKKKQSLFNLFNKKKILH